MFLKKGVSLPCTFLPGSPNLIYNSCKILVMEFLKYLHQSDTVLPSTYNNLMMFFDLDFMMKWNSINDKTCKEHLLLKNIEQWSVVFEFPLHFEHFHINPSSLVLCWNLLAFTNLVQKAPSLFSRPMVDNVVCPYLVIDGIYESTCCASKQFIFWSEAMVSIITSLSAFAFSAMR